MRYKFDRFSLYVGYVVVFAAVTKLLGFSPLMNMLVQLLNQIPAVYQPLSLLAAAQ